MRQFKKQLKSGLTTVNYLLLIGFSTSTFAADNIQKIIDNGESAFKANCSACHQVDRFSVGPSLVYIRDAYPKSKKNDFINWVKSPGKKNPETIQMPAMSHLESDAISAIQEYILYVTKYTKEKIDKPKFSFKRPAKTYPAIDRKLLALSSPASIQVAFNKDWSICWDTSIAKMRYIFPSKIDMTPPRKTASENTDKIIYMEDANELWSFAKGQKIKFQGYKITAGLPEFIYQIGAIKIKEKLSFNSEKQQVIRHFNLIGVNQDISLNLTHHGAGRLTASQGTWQGQTLHLSAQQAAAFTLEVAL